MFCQRGICLARLSSRITLLTKRSGTSGRINWKGFPSVNLRARRTYSSCMTPQPLLWSTLLINNLFPRDYRLCGIDSLHMKKLAAGTFVANCVRFRLQIWWGNEIFIFFYRASQSSQGIIRKCPRLEIEKYICVQSVRHPTLKLANNGDSLLGPHFLWLVLTNMSRFLPVFVTLAARPICCTCLPSPKHTILFLYIKNRSHSKFLPAATEDGTNKQTVWNVWNDLYMLTINAHFSSSRQLFLANKALKPILPRVSNSTRQTDAVSAMFSNISPRTG